MSGQQMLCVPFGESIQETMDKARAFQLLNEEKAKKAKEERLKNLESDLLELLAESRPAPSTPPGFFGMSGLSAWLSERPTIQSRIKDLAREVANEKLVTYSNGGVFSNVASVAGVVSKKKAKK